MSKDLIDKSEYIHLTSPITPPCIAFCTRKRIGLKRVHTAARQCVMATESPPSIKKRFLSLANLESILHSAAFSVAG